MKQKVLQNIIALLGSNYKKEDEQVLKTLLDLVISQAEEISNREITDDEKDANFKILTPEIINATIIAYQNRGVESVKSQSELGESNTFVDYTEKLRTDIIKNGKRIVG
jgi:hypothetical protein